MDEATARLLDLLDEFGRRLHVVLVKITLREEVAEELLQELFLKLRASSGFANASHPERYLFRTAIHLAFDWRKRHAREAAHTSPLENQADASPAASHEIEQREDLERVLQAVEQLPPDDRDLIVMRFLQGTSYEALASHFDTTPHRLRATCSRIIAGLREQLAASERKAEGEA